MPATSKPSGYFKVAFFVVMSLFFIWGFITVIVDALVLCLKSAQPLSVVPSFHHSTLADQFGLQWDFGRPAICYLHIIFYGVKGTARGYDASAEPAPQKALV